MQNTKLGLSLVLAVAWLWTGCEKKASAPAGPTILATVGSQVITADDLQNEAARLLEGGQLRAEHGRGRRLVCLDHRHPGMHA